MEFDDLIGFVEHLAMTHIAVEHETHKALDKAAGLIQRDAKRRIGHYQEQVGPHPAWADLTDETQAQREKAGFTPNDPLLRTGDLRDSIEREVNGGDAVIGSKKMEAQYQEFGTRTIPARPFLGPAAYVNKEKIQDLIGQAAIQGLFYNTRLGVAQLETVHANLGYNEVLGGE